MFDQDFATAPQDIAQRTQPPGNLSQHDFAAWLDALSHSLRIAQPTDALAPSQWGFIVALTLCAALTMEAHWYRGRGRRPLPGFRAGVCMGLLVSVSALLALGWLAARSLVSGAIRCMSRHCHGTDFTDLLGHRHISGEHAVSMTFDPGAFWASYTQLSIFIVTALTFLFSCLRSCRHWRELD